MTVTVTGRNGVPRGAAAVVAQVTVVAGATKSTVRLSPDGTLARAVPVVTVPAGHTLTVPVVAPLAADGRVTVLASRVGARVSVDVTGYLVRRRRPRCRRADEGSVAGPGVRLPRSDVGPLGRNHADDARPRTQRCALVGGLRGPRHGRGSQPRTAGWLAVYPAGLARPIARSLTYDVGVGVRTTVLAKVGTGGAIKIYVPAGQVAVIVDVAGYVTS